MESYITEDTLHQCYFKSGNTEISKNKEYFNFLHAYCDSDHAIYIFDRLLVTSTVHIFNGTIMDWCDKKQYGTSRNSSNSETRAMYTGVLDQNWIRYLFRSISYPIGPPSKIYEYNKAKIYGLLTDIITLQARPLDLLITATR